MLLFSGTPQEYEKVRHLFEDVEIAPEEPTTRGRAPVRREALPREVGTKKRFTEAVFEKALENFSDRQKTLLHMLLDYEQDGIGSDDLREKFMQETGMNHHGYGGTLGSMAKKITKELGRSDWEWSQIIEEHDDRLWPGPLLIKIADKL